MRFPAESEPLLAAEPDWRPMRRQETTQGSPLGCPVVLPSWVAIAVCLPEDGDASGQAVERHGSREILHVVVADAADPLIGADRVVPTADEITAANLDVLIAAHPAGAEFEVEHRDDAASRVERLSDNRISGAGLEVVGSEFTGHQAEVTVTIHE